MVNFWLTLDAGFASDQLAHAGTARLSAAVLISGTATRDAMAISEELQSLGAQLTANSNLDLTQVFLSALKGKLDASLDLFADVILNPSFPESDSLRQQHLQLATIEQEKAQPMAWPFVFCRPFSMAMATAMLRRSPVGHSGKRRQTDPRRRRELPPHMVPSQQRHPHRGWRHHGRGDQARNSKSSSPSGNPARSRPNMFSLHPSPPSRWCTSFISQAPSNR